MIPMIPAIENNVINESNKYNIDKILNIYLNDAGKINNIKLIKLFSGILHLNLILEKFGNDLFFGLGLIGFIFIIFTLIVLMASIVPAFIYLLNDLLPFLIDVLVNIFYLFIGFIALTIFIIPSVIIIALIWIFSSIFWEEN